MAPRFSSSIAQKLLMAITGLLLLGFVVGHLAGNLLILTGEPDAINAYAYKLKSLGPLLWVARIGLLVILVAHVSQAVRLTVQNRRAAGEGYQVGHVNKATAASLTMMISGVLILAFVAFHLAHFTAGYIGDQQAYEAHDAQGRHDVYNMVVHSFSNPETGLLYSTLYIAAMCGLGFHLVHAITSALQTFGIENERLRQVCYGVAMALSVGYMIIPFSIHIGLVQAVPAH